MKENNVLESNLEIDINVSSKIELKPRFFIYADKKSSSSIKMNWNNSFCNINSVFDFYLDKDSTKENLVFNRTTTLRGSFLK